ncbi:amidohydrolase [Seinonella peptonophila]|nr:amidohydrolase [Seinonella peptonophila]
MVHTDEVIESGALGIEEDQIIYTGKKPSPEELAKYDEVVDVKGKIILPGFINTHGHAAMTLLRGYGDNLPLQEWLEDKVWPMEARFTDEHVAAGTALAIVEMIRSGTTCFLDMYDHMDAVAQEVEKSGIRAVLSRGVIGFDSEEVQRAKLQDAVTFARTWNNAADKRITTMLAPHSAYTCSPKLITQFIDRAAEFSIPLHTHLSETAREVEQNVQMYGERPVKHLESLSFFDFPCIVAHAVHLTDEEIQILANHQVKIAHNPRSNLKLGSGIAPIMQMMKAGIRPGLATDGASSNNRLNMLDEIQLVALIHKGYLQESEAISAYQALQMGTVYGAESVFLEKKIGTLEIGKQADFITIDTSRPNMQPTHNHISNVVFAATSEDISDVYVDGKALLKERKCVVMDEEKIIYEANEAIQQLL